MKCLKRNCFSYFHSCLNPLSMLSFIAERFWYQKREPNENNELTSEESEQQQVVNQNIEQNSQKDQEEYEYRSLPVEKENTVYAFVDEAMHSIVSTTNFNSDVLTDDANVNNNTNAELLQQSLKRLQSLEQEASFLYQVVIAQQQALNENGVDFGGIAQTCAICRDEFSFNSNESCFYHPGNLIPVQFKDLPDAVIDSYRPKSVYYEAPRKFWVMSCCKNAENSPGCCVDRHVPEEIEGLESTVYLDQSRLACSKAFFGSESMVMYN